MPKFEAKISVLQSEWETRWIEVEADSEDEAETKINNHDYEVVDLEMGDVENSNLEIEIDYIEEEREDNGK